MHIPAFHAKAVVMKHDVIILGGGIIGVTLGYYLARDGLKPLIIEPGEIAGGTTGASFAWANASTKTSDAAYHRLNADGMAGYCGLMAEYGGPALGINPSGALQVVSRSDAPGFEAMVSDAKKLSGFGYRATLVDHQTLREFEPGLSFTDEHEALYLPDDMIIDAPRFTREMARLMQSHGGAILKATPTGLIADDNGVVSGVETSDGPHYAAAVVTAAGKDTGQLLDDITGFAPFASRFPLRQVPGFLMTTPPVPPETLRHLIYTSTTDELHLLPAPNGGLKIGSDDVDALIWEDRSPQAMQAAARALLTRAKRFLPDLAAMVDVNTCRLQIGIRAYPEDAKSLIGPLPGATGLYVIATHSGITLAPIIGSLMAGWIASGKAPGQLTPYALSRFAGFA